MVTLATSSLLWKLGCFNAAFAIICASIGGHKPWDEERKRIYSKGVNLHLFSSVGIILSSFKYNYICGFGFLLGSLLFCCTAYYRCFKDDKSFNKLMPIGGSLFIFSWLLLAFA